MPLNVVSTFYVFVLNSKYERHHESETLEICQSERRENNVQLKYFRAEKRKTRK